MTEAGKLDPDVERRLAAIAAGRGRTPTAAHPDCTCIASAERRARESRGLSIGADVKACPIHGRKP